MTEKTDWLKLLFCIFTKNILNKKKLWMIKVKTNVMSKENWQLRKWASTYIKSV